MPTTEPESGTDGAGPLAIGPECRLDFVRTPGRRGIVVAIWWLLTVGLLEKCLPDRPPWWRHLLGLMMIGPLLSLYWWMFQKAAWRSITWRLDEEGVADASSAGEASYLRWIDVEAIQPSQDVIRLRGRGVLVVVPLTVPGTDREAVFAMIESKLPAGFDMHARPPVFGPTGAFLQGVVRAVAWTLLFLATAMGPMLIQEAGGPRAAWIGFASFYVWAWIACGALHRHAREAEEATWLRRPTGEP
jgi:hypothetical protein